MKIQSKCNIAAKHALLLTLFFGAVPFISQAQQLKMSDFVLFAGFGTCPAGANAPLAPGCAVQIGSTNNITGNGAIGSYTLIQSTGGASISGNLNSNGKINLANNNTITGKVTVANTSNASGTILQTGSGLNISGNVDVHGNINISSGTIGGKVTQDSAKYTYVGPTPPGRIVAPLNLPILPGMPAVKTFTIPAGAKDIITNNFKPDAGVIYKNVTFSGNKTLIFKDTGSYYFNSITLTSNNTFVFDFNNHPGTIRIYVLGNMFLDKISTIIKGGGNEGKIFTETNGNSGPFAFTIANGSPTTPSRWSGTVWAPYSGINIGSGTGSSQLTGAFWSGTQINTGSGVNLKYAPYNDCISPNAYAGPDKPLSFKDTTTLIGTPLSASFSYTWVAADGGIILDPSANDTILVTTTGTYILTVTSSVGCSAKDTVVVTSKDNGLIGSELTSMYYNTLSRDPNSPFFTVQQDSVLIDIIAKEGKLNEVVTILTGSTYGLSTQLRSNGDNLYRITGMYPIKNLLLLNLLKDIIVYCMPHYSAVGGVWPGQARTLGDSAMRSNFIRNGYQLYGEGVKIGVLSDSYNTIPGDPAGVDVSNGDLPGPANPINTQPVQVTDYPYGGGIDEGRAMLQIIHDIAPKATVEFRTGIISAGDMAAGIRQLKQDGCNVIVDDITHITESFLKVGEIAKAVNDVSKDDVNGRGVAYFSAAGNFGNKSYQSIFKKAVANGSAHDFGGGDSLQRLSLKKGNYTIVLQWQDSIYSIGQTQTGGTQNDLDIYLTTNNGITRFGYNRNNLGGDPIEILPFTINTDVETDLFIVRAAGTTNNLFLKYIIFRGEGTITEHTSGNATIVGQANADSAFAIGAVQYSNTPVFGTNVPLIQSYSSYGSVTRNAAGDTIRVKPDFTAPDGVRTTVTFGNSTNFFGTSAAAPHAAAVAALLIQAKNKYYSTSPATQVNLSVGELRSIFKKSALEMATPGRDSISGAGFIRADKAIQSFAAALPALIRLVIPEGVILGTESFTLGVKGNYLSPNTIVYFNGQPVPTTILTDSTASAIIPTFTGQPPIQAITSSITPSGLDGGSSNILYFNSVVKRNIVIKAADTTMKYGEQIPIFRYAITVDGQPLASTNLTLAAIGLAGTSDIVLSTTATSTSSVNNYAITTTIRHFDPGTADSNLLKLYNYSTPDGTLTIARMPITITPIDVSNVTYGQAIPTIQFNYVYNDSKIANKTAFLDSIKAIHQRQIVPNTFGVINAVLSPTDITNLSFMTSGKLSIQSGKLSIQSGKLSIQSGMIVVDVPQQSFTNYQSSDLNSLVNGKLIISTTNFINSTFLNGKLIINGKLSISTNSLINSQNADSVSKNNIAVMIDSIDLVPSQSTDSVFVFRSLNLITGGITAGSHFIVPGAFITSNFDVTYSYGNLNISKATLTVMPDTAFNFKGDKLPATLTYIYKGLSYDDSNVIVTAPAYYVKDASGNIYLPGTIMQNAGVYSSYAQGLQLTTAANNNYIIPYTYAPGAFYVNPKGNTARNVKPNLDCVDTLIGDPNYKYQYRFSYQNPNSTVVYVPRGVNNFITFNGVDYKTRAAGPYGGVQPELFLTTGGKFTIKANGETTKWSLITYDGNQKTQTTSITTSTSNKCGSGGAGRPIMGNTSRATITSKDVVVYPNPVFNRLVVMFPQSLEAKNEISISDVTGKTYKLKSLQKNADGSLVFNMSNFSKGVYYVKVNSDKNSKIFKIIKL